MAAADPDAHPELGDDRVGAAVAPLIASGLAALR